MPSTDTRVEVAVGLVHQAGDLHAHLRDALRDLGASIVYETETAKFDRAALDQVDDVEVRGLEVQPVRDHEADVLALTRLDHGLALFRARGHGLLAQHVYAVVGRADGRVGMHVIG